MKEVPAQPVQPVRPKVVEGRARQIYALFLNNPTTLFETADVRAAIEMPEGRPFRDAMTNARALAKEDGNIISYCFPWEGRQVMCLNPPDRYWLLSKATRGRAITAQDVNYVGFLEWGAQNIKSPMLRKLATREAQARSGAVMMADAFNGMAHDIYSEMMDSDEAAA